MQHLKIKFNSEVIKQKARLTVDVSVDVLCLYHNQCLLQFKRNQYSENEQGIARNSETRWKLLESLRLERERSRVDR